jgi:hypothetical protein
MAKNGYSSQEPTEKLTQRADSAAHGQPAGDSLNDTLVGMPAQPQASEKRPGRSGLAVGLATAAVVAAAALAIGAAGSVSASLTGADSKTGKPDVTQPVGHDNAGKQAKSDKASGTAKEKKGSNGSPSPSQVGLCHAYESKTGDYPGKALENPAFGSLISAAGGKSNVTNYCEDVLASAKNDRGGDKGDRDDHAENGKKNGHGQEHGNADRD